MKKNIPATVVLLFTIFTVFSCNSESKKDGNTHQDSLTTDVSKSAEQDYSGVYKVSAENSCQLTLTITKNGQAFNYQFKGDKLDCSGNLVVENVDGEVYLTFDGQIAENKPKSVSAKYVNGSVIIQNYGNSMNEYNYFKNCEEKYLEFMK